MVAKLAACTACALLPAEHAVLMSGPTSFPASAGSFGGQNINSIEGQVVVLLMAVHQDRLLMLAPREIQKAYVCISFV